MRRRCAAARFRQALNSGSSISPAISTSARRAGAMSSGGTPSEAQKTSSRLSSCSRCSSTAARMRGRTRLGAQLCRPQPGQRQEPHQPIGVAGQKQQRRYANRFRPVALHAPQPRIHLNVERYTYRVQLRPPFGHSLTVGYAFASKLPADRARRIGAKGVGECELQHHEHSGDQHCRSASARAAGQRRQDGADRGRQRAQHEALPRHSRGAWLHDDPDPQRPGGARAGARVTARH